VTLLSGDVINVSEAMGRMALVALYTTVSMTGMLAIGLFISTPGHRALHLHSHHYPGRRDDRCVGDQWRKPDFG